MWILICKFPYITACRFLAICNLSDCRCRQSCISVNVHWRIKNRILIPFYRIQHPSSNCIQSNIFQIELQAVAWHSWYRSYEMQHRHFHRWRVLAWKRFRVFQKEKVQQQKILDWKDSRKHKSWCKSNKTPSTGRMDSGSFLEQWRFPLSWRMYFRNWGLYLFWMNTFQLCFHFKHT